MAGSDAAPAIRWGRVIGMFVLALLAFEGIGRIYVRKWSGQPFQSLSPYKWSPYGLVRNNPALNSPGFKINENGFRNTAIFTKKKPPNTIRIVMLGGSVLYSGLVPGAARVGQSRVTSDETMAQYLERRLKSDPAFRGMRIEVINAGVNFNMVREVTLAYLSEYVFWDPDLVIVCGSANNFGPAWPAPLNDNQANAIQADHPWRSEFDRMVNESSVASVVEVTIRAMSENSAAVSLLNKAAGRAFDLTFDRLASTAPVAAAPTQDARTFAPQSEIHDLVRDYMGYADAIVSAAHEHDQQVAFFWEYFLGEMQGLKQMSADERRIFPLIRWRVTDPRDRDFHFMVRDTLRARLEAQGSIFIDPLPELSLDSGTVYMDYLHYTSYGNRMMAEVMYRRLADRLHDRARMLQTARR